MEREALQLRNGRWRLHLNSGLLTSGSLRKGTYLVLSYRRRLMQFTLLFFSAIAHATLELVERETAIGRYHRARYSLVFALHGHFSAQSRLLDLGAN